LVGAGVIVDFPETEAHEGHLVAVVQLDGRGNHCECVDSNLVLVVFRAKNWIVTDLRGIFWKEKPAGTGYYI
jgi:hypothetical protein